MKIMTGLSRQIVLSMAMMALGVTLLVLIGSYIFYALLMVFSPNRFHSIAWIPTGPEWLWMGATAIVAIALAVFAALKLSRRILAPLNSVVDSLRSMARGDLAARAVSDDHSLGEAAQLVNDFNAMAVKLQHMEQERAFWNAAIAHELRTPVTILRGRLQGLTDGVFEPAPSLFRSLLTQVEGLSHLIEDLRVLALADSGHLRLQQERTHLAAEVAAVIQAFEADLHNAGFTLSLDLDDRPVVCDPVRIRQALLAILENALRHANPGLLQIQTRIENDRCHLSVEDSGPGITREFAAQIFEAFKRGTPSNSDKRSGTGLGLAVVQAIAQAHGGRATCQLSAAGGARFEISWPAPPR